MVIRKSTTFRVGFWLLAVVLSGCGSEAPSPAPAKDVTPPAPLSVAAASDLQAALPEIISAFEKEPTGFPVRATFGSSGQLTEQIKAGAPFDLFMAANRAFVRDLATEHFILEGSDRPYAVGSLVLAVRTNAKVVIETLADLTKPEVKRVAIANPVTAPYGAAAKQALTKAGLWAKLEPKLVLAESVRQASMFVRSGNAEAGLIGKATAGVPDLKSVEVDTALYDPLVQGLGVVERSSNGVKAEAFAAFVLSPKGQAVLASFGFKPPPQNPKP